jgi:23S rRNA pseudouridine2605 synthase
MNKFRQNYSQPKNRYNPSRNNNRREDEPTFNPDDQYRSERFNRPPRHRDERYSADRKPYNNPNRNQRPGENLYDKPVRLNRLIAMSGFCSRRKADEYIESGAVKVNGVVVMDLGTKVHPREDRVEFKGQVIKPERPVYIILNKPKNAITTVDDPEGRPTVMDFVKNVGNYRIFPVGRLDRNTTGILLMTNDGEVAKVLTHPSYEISKVYRVLLDKEITQNEIKRLLTGIDLEDGVAKIDKIAFSEHSTTRHEVLVQIHSGRNRVIRRMFEALGFKVKSLDRISFGPLTKKGVQKGRWRYLNPKEVNFLHMAVATAKRQIYATGEQWDETDDKADENYIFPAEVEQEEYNFDFNELSNEGGFNNDDVFEDAVLDDLEDQISEEDNRYNSESYQRTRETQQQKTGFRGRNTNQQRRNGGGHGRSNNNYNQNRGSGYSERRDYSANRGDGGGYNQNRGSGYGERRDYNTNRGDGGGYNQNRGSGYGERRDYNANRGDGGGYNQNRGSGYGERRDYNANRRSNDRPSYYRNESGNENRNRRNGDNQRSNYNDRPRTNYGNRNDRSYRSNSENIHPSSERRSFKRSDEQTED